MRRRKDYDMFISNSGNVTGNISGTDLKKRREEASMESVTIKDIAKKCNVAVSTVSRALNNHPDINEQTRQKILKAIQELHYIPNNSAQNLKKTASKTIGIVVKGADNPLFAKMRSILAENIAQYDYDYYFEYISIREDEIRTALRLIKEKRLKGLIFLGGNYNRKLEDLQQLTVPFVMSTVNIQEEVPRAAFSSVFTDSYKESRRMVEYLCRKGFQKIVIFAGSKNDASVGNLRLKGYLDELAANQIPPDENRIFFSPDQAEDVFTMENGYRMAKKLIQSGIAFDCIYAIADAIAIGACKALLEKGIRIPQECAVAGFDGLDVTRYYHPSITTMRQPIEKMAEESVRILFSRIHKKTENEHCEFSCQLLRRESTNIENEKETDGGTTF